MRRILDRGVIAGAWLCAAVVAGVLAGVAATLVARGVPALSWGFLIEPMRAAGAAGGIVHNILGTSILLATALGVGLPVAMGVALVHSVYLRRERARTRLWLFLSALNGIPSILFGLFGLLLFVRVLGWNKSWLAGGILLGFMIVPIIAVGFIERIRALPRTYIEAAAALGLRPSRIVWSVIVPQCGSGLLTGALLGLARAAGETAPLLFTATVFSGAALFPDGIRDSPVLTMPYHIFVLSQDSLDPAMGRNAWGAALVLWLMVMGLSLLALPTRLRSHEEAGPS